MEFLKETILPSKQIHIPQVKIPGEDQGINCCGLVIQHDSLSDPGVKVTQRILLSLVLGEKGISFEN